MRIYKVTFDTNHGGQHVHWGRSLKHCAEIKRVHKSIEVEHLISEFKITPIDFTPTKGGILGMLAQHCPDHDNG